MAIEFLRLTAREYSNKFLGMVTVEAEFGDERILKILSWRRLLAECNVAAFDERPQQFPL